MFATFRRFRRHVAVLTALAMLASVLVAVPVSAADDPEPDFEATFDACGTAPDSGFTDVPSMHSNAGDINCIAYYGVTKGTSATTYSPIQSVTREHMALFLTRLAALVDISVNDAPDDPGFMDTGDLGDESQMAIAQLADLDITQGTSDTTYSPGDDVSRAQMAQFISRLMDQMVPQADGEIGLRSTTQYGYTPSDVADNDMDADIGSPYGDLGRSTKDEYDSITNLYELGVASGISDTSYSPESPITRAAMAEFMAAVLDHSNARPAGISIQATPSDGWGDVAATVMVSVRDDSFGAVENQPVDVFSSTSANNGLRKDGTCNFSSDPDDVNFGDLIEGDCTWNDNDDATDVDGNVVLESDVLQGSTRIIYAWIGEDDGDEFDADSADEVSTSVTAKKEQDALKIESTINEHADTGYDLSEGPKVDLRAVSEVTFTAQLIDEDKSDVKRAGIEVRVEYRQGKEGEGDHRDLRSYVNTHEAELETDENGQVSFTVSGPADNRRISTQFRADDIVFAAEDLMETAEDIYWVEEEPVLTTTSVKSPVYVIAGNKTAVRTTVYLYDQYGDPHQSHRAQQAEIVIATGDEITEDAADTSSVRQVISRGYASWRRALDTAAGTPVTVSYDVRMLARNSNGVAVQDWIATDDDLDDNDITYNDGRVTILRTVADDGEVTLGDVAVYDRDDDSDDTTPVSNDTNDDTNDTTPVSNDDDDDTTTDVDTPVIASATEGDEEFLITRSRENAAVSVNIFNMDAKDLFDTRPTDGGGTAQEEVDGTDSVEVVARAVSTDVGTVAGTMGITNGDLDGEFLVDTGIDGNADRVYSYDADDIFIDSTKDEGVEITMDSFAAKIKEGPDRVEVLAYDIDGTSIFRLVS